MSRDKGGKREEHNGNGDVYFHELYELEVYYRQGKSHFDCIVIINDIYLSFVTILFMLTFCANETDKLEGYYLLPGSKKF